jgi:SAM-dependent methyltransferase
MIIRKIYRILKKIKLKLLQIYFQITGNKVECNICHYKANRFKSDSWHLYSVCPNCSSGIRHRLLIASLTYLEKFNFEKIIFNKKILHFAPENSIRKLISKIAKEYKTADFYEGGYSYDNLDYNIDISDMKIIKDETFDCIIACDILEHVTDHIKAIEEVQRILKKGGYCIFTVPQKDNLKITYEDNSITDKKEREKAFGQFDHVRIYGDDFIDMMQNQGLESTAIDESFFDKKLAKYNVLFPPVLSTHPLATNYRKIFFGRKK